MDRRNFLCSAATAAVAAVSINGTIKVADPQPESLVFLEPGKTLSLREAEALRASWLAAMPNGPRMIVLPAGFKIHVLTHEATCVESVP